MWKGYLNISFKLKLDRLVCFLKMLYVCFMKHSEIRQNIIETASNLFYKNGYNRTGINEIISESGIAKATLYNHFKSKEDVCVAYLEYMNGTFLGDIEKFCTSKPKGKKQVLAFFDFLLAFFNDRDFNGCWCIRTVSEIPKDNQKIKTEIQRHKKMFIELIKKIVTENNLKDSAQEVDNLSKQVYLLYESAVAESHLHQVNWPIKSTKKMCEQILA